MTARQTIPPSLPPATSRATAHRPGPSWPPSAATAPGSSRQHLYSPKHTATTWQLDILADLGFSGEDEPVRRACDLFFAWQGPDGAFNITRAPHAGYACVTGRVLAQLHRFGLGGHPGVALAWDWLAATQRADGGWHCRPDHRLVGKHSCLIGTVKALEAAAASLADATPGAVRPAADLARRGASFLLDSLLAPRAERYSCPTLWDRLVYPNHWYDAAGVVELLAAFGYGTSDTRVAAAVEHIAALQNPDGSWNHGGELAFRGPTLYAFGRPGEPSPWVTLRAARAVKRACSPMTPPATSH